MAMLSSIFAVIAMIVGVVLDIITLPFRAALVLLNGAEIRVQAIQPAAAARTGLS
jgi:hypothetical protein